MGFNCGIVGLPNVGKSTIFNAITKAGAASANYPFCTIEPNVGRVDVPDPRLDEIQTVVKTQKVIPASMEFVDIAGLVAGASKGEGLGNKFLGHIRSTDAIVNVVRCFDDDDITHVDGDIDPVRDIQTISTELVFSDIETVENTLDRYKKLAKSGRKDVPPIVAMLEALQDHLQGLKPARTFELEPFVGDIQEVEFAYRDLHMITNKRSIYVCNVNEEMANGKTDNKYTLAVKEHAKGENAQVLMICGKLEEELSEMDPEDQREMYEGLDMTEPGLDALIRAGYATLDLETYFTAGEKEVRAWTIHKGDSAPVAAGKIHSDFERGFICAEVFSIPDLIDVGSRPALKEKGKLRIEGKEYIVQDGDVMEFRFNV
jgi:ribosome-binding ATPase